MNGNQMFDDLIEEKEHPKCKKCYYYYGKKGKYCYRYEERPSNDEIDKCKYFIDEIMEIWYGDVLKNSYKTNIN
jgi:hypothetical protein